MAVERTVVEQTPGCTGQCKDRAITYRVTYIRRDARERARIARATPSRGRASTLARDTKCQKAIDKRRQFRLALTKLVVMRRVRMTASHATERVRTLSRARQNGWSGDGLPRGSQGYETAGLESASLASRRLRRRPAKKSA